MTTKTPMRINARIDPETEARIARIRARTGWSTTDVVKRGVAALDAETRRQQQSPHAIAEAVGLYGVASGDENLSSDYKALLGDSLRGKHG